MQAPTPAAVLVVMVVWLAPLSRGETSGTASPSSCNADELVVYRLFVDTHWSRELFPKQYPEWRPPAGWSKVLGRTHDSSYWLFREGELSSAGLQAFAEKGLSDGLEAADHAGVYDEFTAPPQPRGVGRTTADFFMDGNHSLVSVAARVVPSPDWFIGVDSLDLCRGNHWIDSIAIEVDPMDAGTDNGFTFTAPNWPSEPKEPVSRITSTRPSHPANSFFYPKLDRLPSIATLTFVKCASAENVSNETTDRLPLRHDQTTTTFSSSETDFDSSALPPSVDSLDTSTLIKTTMTTATSNTASSRSTLSLRAHSTNPRPTTRTASTPTTDLTSDRPVTSALEFNDLARSTANCSVVRTVREASAFTNGTVGTPGLSPPRSGTSGTNTSAVNAESAESDPEDTEGLSVHPSHKATATPSDVGFGSRPSSSSPRASPATTPSLSLEEEFRPPPRPVEPTRATPAPGPRPRDTSAPAHACLAYVPSLTPTFAQTEIDDLDDLMEERVYHLSTELSRAASAASTPHDPGLIEGNEISNDVPVGIGFTPGSESSRTTKARRSKKAGRQAKHCVVSEWSPWSPCSASCGVGDATRARRVLEHPRRGGRPCPALQERRWCGGHSECPQNFFNW